jgi:hypothetical protein
MEAATARRALDGMEMLFLDAQGQTDAQDTNAGWLKIE